MDKLREPGKVKDFIDSVEELLKNEEDEPIFTVNYKWGPSSSQEEVKTLKIDCRKLVGSKGRKEEKKGKLNY